MSSRENSRANWFAGRRLEATLLAILLFTALFHLTSFQEGHDWGGDFSSYVHQAKSLVEGTVAQLHAVALFRLENSSTEAMVGPTFYPWGLPLLLSPVYALFGLKLLPMKVLVLAFALAAQATTFFLLRRRLPDCWVLLITFLMGVNPVIFSFKNSILSDIPFLFFVLLSLNLMQRVVVDRRSVLAPAGHHVLLGLTMFCACLIRTHGLALIPTLAMVQAVQFWDREDGTSLRVVTSAIKRLSPVSIIPYVVLAVGAVLIRLTLVGADSSYLASNHFVYGSLNDFLALFAYNVAYYASLPSRFLDMSTFGQALNIVVLIPLALFGAYCRVKRDYLLSIFTAFHMAVLLVYPYHLGMRAILPVIPIYLYFATAGAIDAQAPLVKRVPSLKPMPTLAALIFLPLSVFLAMNTGVRWTILASRQKAVVEGPYTTTSLDLFSYVRANTPESAVFTFWKPRVLTLYTGRRGIRNFRPERIVDDRSDFLLVHTNSNPESRRLNGPLRKVVTRNPERFELMYRNPDFLLYRILSEEAKLDSEVVLEPTDSSQPHMSSGS